MLIIRSANTALSELNTVDDNDDNNNNNDDTLASRTTSQLLLCFRKMNPSKKTLLPRKRAAKGEFVKNPLPRRRARHFFRVAILQALQRRRGFICTETDSR